MSRPSDRILLYSAFPTYLGALASRPVPPHLGCAVDPAQYSAYLAWLPLLISVDLSWVELT